MDHKKQLRTGLVFIRDNGSYVHIKGDAQMAETVLAKFEAAHQALFECSFEGGPGDEVSNVSQPGK